MGTESEGELYIMGTDGTAFKWSDVRLVQEQEQTSDEAYATIDAASSFTCELRFVMRHRKGYLDYIGCKCTPAARRYLRASRRRKEKQRRRKLKEALK